MKTALEIGTALVKLCREGKNAQAIETLYSKDIKCIEAVAMGGSREAEGMDAILGKTKWWGENHTVHSAKIEGPFPFDDRFAVYFNYDVTQKQSDKRIVLEEVGVYYVQNGKIVREEFMFKP